jgi:hypothetical protein
VSPNTPGARLPERGDDNPVSALLNVVTYRKAGPRLVASNRAGSCRGGDDDGDRNASSLLLVRLGIPPAIIYKGDRSRYLAAVRRADMGRDAGA